MRIINSFEDVQRALNELNDKLDKLSMRSIDMHGNRITNAGFSRDKKDYVTREELDTEVKGLWEKRG